MKITVSGTITRLEVLPDSVVVGIETDPWALQQVHVGHEHAAALCAHVGKPCKISVEVGEPTEDVPPRKFGESDDWTHVEIYRRGDIVVHGASSDVFIRDRSGVAPTKETMSIVMDAPIAATFGEACGEIRINSSRQGPIINASQGSVHISDLSGESAAERILAGAARGDGSSPSGHCYGNSATTPSPNLSTYMFVHPEGREGEKGINVIDPMDRFHAALAKHDCVMVPSGRVDECIIRRRYATQSLDSVTVSLDDISRALTDPEESAKDFASRVVTT